jgi:hypothetical protein
MRRPLLKKWEPGRCRAGKGEKGKEEDKNGNTRKPSLKVHFSSKINTLIIRQKERKIKPI